jgi:hypothetical protein
MGVMSEAFLQEAPCKSCKGEGTKFSKGFEYQGRVYPDRNNPCTCCGGTGQFPGLDVPGIIEMISAGKGDKKRFRAAWPSKFSPWKNAAAKRAYYVWRLARFHGGADVTMPFTASFAVDGDPHRDALDRMADAVAKKVFGTDMAAAHRWGNLLGFAPKGVTPPNLPASAHEGGPVVTSGEKPSFEQLELL